MCTFGNVSTFFLILLVCILHKMFLNVQMSLSCGLMSRVFANGPGDQGSIPGRVIPKTQKMVLDATLLSTQHYKVRIKGKVEQSREWSGTLHYTSVWELLKREPSGHPWLRLPTLLLLIIEYTIDNVGTQLNIPSSTKYQQ